MNDMTDLTPAEKQELHRLKAYHPFRICSAVKTAGGVCQFFANCTAAQANNYARKHGGQVWRLK